MNRITYELDVAKPVFQMHWVGLDTGKVCNQRFSRAQLVEFLSKSAPEHGWCLRRAVAGTSGRAN